MELDGLYWFIEADNNSHLELPKGLPSENSWDSTDRSTFIGPLKQLTLSWAVKDGQENRSSVVPYENIENHWSQAYHNKNWK